MQLVLWVARLVPFRQLLPQLDLDERPDLSGTAEGLWIEPAQLPVLARVGTHQRLGAGSMGLGSELLVAPHPPSQYWARTALYLPRCRGVTLSRTG
jgi:hypothetical protein